jgi:hypothetical protein
MVIDHLDAVWRAALAASADEAVAEGADGAEARIAHLAGWHDAVLDADGRVDGRHA